MSKHKAKAPAKEPELEQKPAPALGTSLTVSPELTQTAERIQVESATLETTLETRKSL